MSTPLVSVVLPTYNRAHVLGRSIRSVLTQTHRDLELIVVDDGSTDDSEGLVQGIGDPRVRYLRRANGGPAAARNTGIEAARGELVAFQDSDDEWLDGKLAAQVQALAAAPAGTTLCVSSFLLVDVGDQWAAQRGARDAVDPGDLRRQALENFFFPTPCWLTRRSALQQAGGFDAGLSCWEDWELAIRLGALGPFVAVDRPLLVRYRDRSDGVNNNLRARMHSLGRMLDRNAACWARTPRTLARHCFTLGHLECLHGSLDQGRAWFRRAIAAAPHWWKPRVGLAFARFDRATYRRLVAWSRARPGRGGDDGPGDAGD